MENSAQPVFQRQNRRSFLKQGVVAAGAATMRAGLWNAPAPFTAQEDEGKNGSLSAGDAAILRFLQVLETIEADIWTQYAELGGATNQGVSPIDLGFTSGISPDYTVALQTLDGEHCGQYGRRDQAYDVAEGLSGIERCGSSGRQQILNAETQPG